METKDIINLIAIVATPIIAVLIGQLLQNKAEKRKDKINIFKVLMTSRIYGLTAESVHYLNLIEVVFSDDKNVCDAWKNLFDKYCIPNPNEAQLNEIQESQFVLLEEMAKSLKYKNIKTIRTPYIPNGIVQKIDEQKNYQKMQNDAMSAVLNFVNKGTSEQK